MDTEMFLGIVTHCYHEIILTFIKWPKMGESSYEKYKLYTFMCFKKEQETKRRGLIKGFIIRFLCSSLQ